MALLTFPACGENRSAKYVQSDAGENDASLASGGTGGSVPTTADSSSGGCNGGYTLITPVCPDVLDPCQGFVSAPCGGECVIGWYDECPVGADCRKDSWVIASNYRCYFQCVHFRATCGRIEDGGPDAILDASVDTGVDVSVDAYVSADAIAVAVDAPADG